MLAHGLIPQGIERDTNGLFLSFLVSIVFHLIFFTGLIYTPRFNPERKTISSVINVSMVTLPEPASEPAEEKPVESVVKPKKEKTVKNPPKKAAKTFKKPRKSSYFVKKREKIKKSLKKKTYRAKKVRESAIKRIETKVEESGADHLARALESLKNRVKKAEAQKRSKHKDKTGAHGQQSAAGGKRILKLIDIYRVEIAYQIQKNWAYSEQLAGGRSNLTVELAFKVMPNGEIRDIWFDRRSGNAYFDESAKKAVMKSNPVRPHPEGVNKPSVIVGLRFTPEGIR